jgi:hypothetical protein
VGRNAPAATDTAVQEQEIGVEILAARYRGSLGRSTYVPQLHMDCVSTGHVLLVISVVRNFRDYLFVRDMQTDLELNNLEL